MGTATHLHEVTDLAVPRKPKPKLAFRKTSSHPTYTTEFSKVQALVALGAYRSGVSGASIQEDWLEAVHD